MVIYPARRMIGDRNGDEIRVPPRIMQVLVALHQGQSEVVSRGVLNLRCWNGRHIGNDALERSVAQLRRLLDTTQSGTSIEAVPRVGYRLVQPAPEPEASPVPEPPSAEPSTQVPDRRVLLVGGAGAVAAGVLAWAGWRAVANDARIAPSFRSVRLAVLPFAAGGTDADARIFAAGLASGMRDQLSRVAGLRVVAEPSSRAVASVSPIDAARRLGVELLVRGTVREDGARLRVGLELIDARDGAILWATTHEDRAQAVFAVQDAASGALLRELVGRIGVERMGALPPPLPHDNGAYRLLAAARQWIDTSRAARMSGDDTAGSDAADRAEALAGQALAIDPAAADALIVLAELERNGWSRRLAALPLTPDQRLERSVALVTRALAIDPNHPGALAALGDYQRRFAWHWDQAETLLRKALAINPSLTEARWSYAYLLGVTGRAVEGLAHAHALAALDPEALYRRLALPRLLYLAGDRAAAMRLYAKERKRVPTDLFLLRELYLILLSERDAAGLRALGRSVQGPGAAAEALAARIAVAADALAGRPAALLALVDADVAAFDAPPMAQAASQQGRASVDYLYILALEAALAGSADRTFALLDRALAARAVYWPATLPYGVAPFPQAVRDDPRWQAVWRSEPARQDLLVRRRAALAAGQAAGWDDAGRMRRVARAAIDRSLASA